MTGGHVSVENNAFELIRRNPPKANLLAFGVGYALADDLPKSL